MALLHAIWTPGLIEARAGLANLVRGTLNVNFSEEYIVQADALVYPDEYPFNKESKNSVRP